MTMTTDQQQRLFQLEEQSKERIVEYHSRIGRDAITALTGIVAVIGFLINSHHISYIEHPALIRQALYLLIIFLSLTFILELLAIRFDAMYAGSFRAYQEATFKNIEDKKSEFNTKQKLWSSFRRWTQRCAELTAVWALCFWHYFCCFY